ncbi:DUF2931 family protein, partial [Salmonella bongori]|nr:DUF2931 family protein [Salmonella bongori]EDP8564439.1 DUF2931 family protein [Salmonella bongori]EDP8608235.1 DUF2931 family protein [Salmonella bongori]EJB3560683.1 DUF2931 family protein [Salmonella bongori]
MTRNFRLLLLGVLLGLSVTATSKELTSLLAPYDEWYFNFLYPNALPADVTYVELLDTDGILYRYRALDGTVPSSTTVEEWEDDLSVGMASFNKAKNPPQAMH